MLRLVLLTRVIRSDGGGSGRGSGDMVLPPSAFPNGLVASLHAVGWALILPCFWSLDRLLALCKSTSLERSGRAEQECYLHPLRVLLGSAAFLLLFLAAAPAALLGFLLWAPLQRCRRPFRYHAERAGEGPPEGAGPGRAAGRASFGFATANLCLLPDSLARFNNLGHTQRRAATIGGRLARAIRRPHVHVFVDSPSSCGRLSPAEGGSSGYGAPAEGGSSGYSAPTEVGSFGYGASAEGGSPGYGASAEGGSPGYGAPDRHSQQVSEHPDSAQSSGGVEEHPGALNSNQNSNQCSRSGQRPPLVQSGAPWEVSPLFPAHVDLLCLEEVFDKRAAEKLVQELKPVLGHILYDVGVYGCQPASPHRCCCCCSAFKFFNSGILVASRFPVLEAQYHCFPNSRGEDALAAKGLLCVKVLIGQNQKQQQVVGFFNSTHLHAPEGEGEIRCHQLDMVTQWIDSFQAAHRRPDEDVVFDVLCGDFNFDNCSPDDAMEQNHRLFQLYRDPCRAAPGSEQPWVVGTLLEQPTLYEDDVVTPENLLRTLETEELRKLYIAPPVPAANTPLVYPEAGQPWIGRRIDYILYRESSISKHCRTEVEEVTFITQLAGLTDHIPVGLRLSVLMDSDNADEWRE